MSSVRAASPEATDLANLSVERRENLQKRLQVHYQTFRSANERYKPTNPGNDMTNLWIIDKVSRNTKRAMAQSFDLNYIKQDPLSGPPSAPVGSSLSEWYNGSRTLTNSNRKKPGKVRLATKRAELFPQEMTKEEKRKTILEGLSENQFAAPFSSKAQKKIRSQYVSIGT